MGVIVGTGKPRIDVPCVQLSELNYTFTLSGTNLALAGTPDLTTTNSIHGVTGRLAHALNSSDAVTKAIILGFNDTTDILTMGAWSNGTPKVGGVRINEYVILLPYCQLLIERFEPDFITHKLYNGAITTKKRGWYYSATLDYARYAPATLLYSLRWLFYASSPDTFTFYPRMDNLGVGYRVRLSPEAIEYSQKPAHQAHNLFVLELLGSERLTDLNLNPAPTNPIVPDGFGDEYGTYYGSNL